MRDHFNEAKLNAEIDRLHKRIKNQRREIEVLRSVVRTLWFGRYNQEWKIVGSGRHSHLNDGHGRSYFGEAEGYRRQPRITAAQQCAAVERSVGKQLRQ